MQIEQEVQNAISYSKELWDKAKFKTRLSGLVNQFLEALGLCAKQNQELIWECPGCGYWNQDHIIQGKEKIFKEGREIEVYRKTRSWICKNPKCEETKMNFIRYDQRVTTDKVNVQKAKEYREELLKQEVKLEVLT